MARCSEVVAIGDEITSGGRLDTNTQWLSKRLGDVGIPVLYHSTVGDDFEASVRVFREALNRADVVVMTGGLGPTQDDLTRRALAEATGREIEVRQEALAHIESLYAQRGRKMPERNKLQAEFPQGSQIIPNPQGTAPGIDLELKHDNSTSTRVFCLPGVPAEMMQMWEQTVAMRLGEEFGDRRQVVNSVVKCFGIGESDLEAKIPELLARDHEPKIGITVNRATISLRIAAYAESIEQCNSQIADVKSILQSRIGDLIYGEGDGYELEHAVADQLAARGQSMCCLELGFNSLADTWLSALERPSVYRGGLSVTDVSHLSTWAKQLNMNADDDAEHAAAKMLELFDTDWCLAINSYPTLVAEEGRSHPGSDIQLIVAGRDLDRPRKLTIHLAGHPDVLPARIAKSGLDLLRKILNSH